MFRLVQSILLATLIFWTPSVFAGTNTWYVDTTACPGPGTGTETDPFCTIGLAIDAAQVGDTVVVQPGRYAETLDFQGKEIRVRSAYGPDVTILDGEGERRVVRLVQWEQREACLEGFTVTGGRANGTGGGIGIKGSPTIKDCIITGNTTPSRGGGIGIRGGRPLITGCKILGNDNRGIYVRSASIEIVDCQITDNDGAGIDMHDPLTDIPITIRRCLIARNGTGISVWRLFEYSVFHLTDCTIVDNVGAGLDLICEDWPTFSVSHLIVWGNGIGINADCENFSAYYSLLQGGGGMLDEDPLFYPGTYYLQQDGTTTSPCVDSGQPGETPPGTTSIDGRPDDEPRDLGYHYPAAFITTADCQGIDDLDVLHVNGETGTDTEHVVQVSRGEPLAASIDLPPGGGDGTFVAQLHPGTAGGTLFPLPADLGDSCFDFRQPPYGTGQPLAVWNNYGRRFVVGATRYFGDDIADPPGAPTTFWSQPAGNWPYLALGTRWTLQAVIRNPDASSRHRLSLTRSIVIEVVN